MVVVTPAFDNNLFLSSLGPEYVGFDHIAWYVGNAKQAASFYVTRMGFKHIAYRGPETGSRVIVSYVVSNGDAVFVLTSPNCAPGFEWDDHVSEEDADLLAEIHDHLTKHGDGVKDVAFRINGNIKAVWKKAVGHGATSISPPTILHKNGHGSITLATIGTYADTAHTLVNREGYTGPFLPGYDKVTEEDPINNLLPQIDVIDIDHCVGNQPWNGVDPVVKYYEECLDFHRYWTVDDKNMCGNYSALRSIVVSSPNGAVKMPMNEPAHGKKKSQIEEFVEYYNTAGVQHIALRTHDLVTTVAHLRQRGVSFLRIPSEYYASLRKQLSAADLQLEEDIDMLEKLQVLVDFDKKGYLLQIFSKHVLDRPTVFIEIIQRNNFDGFGAGNFKSLFEAFESEQAQRGNL